MLRTFACCEQRGGEDHGERSFQVARGAGRLHPARCGQRVIHTVHDIRVFKADAAQRPARFGVRLIHG